MVTKDDSIAKALKTGEEKAKFITDRIDKRVTVVIERANRNGSKVTKPQDDTRR